MAFEGLTAKLNQVFHKLGNRGVIREKDVKEAMREVRLALLEADVNFKVARDFVNRVSEEAMGEAVLKSLTPGQQVIKIVHEALVEMMGGGNERLGVSSKLPTVILLCGLQGAGKTTFAAKLGMYLKRQGKKPLLVACDVYRPAAMDQLVTVGKTAEVPVYTEKGSTDPVAIALAAIKHADYELLDTVIIDTAGRTHIDDDMMQEMQRMVASTHPEETLLVADAMTGQEAVNIAASFHEAVPLTGIVLTKLDGDTRGGAALSMRAVTGKPIKFSGIGEKMTDIEVFHPDRMANRVLGMGDVLTMIEKAEEAFSIEEAAKLEEKFRKNTFTLDDFLDQFEQMRQMGSPEELMNMLPGANKMKMSEAAVDPKQMDRMEAIIRSMTREERTRPEIINASRRRRIARGSGMQVSDVNRLLNQYDTTKKMMRSLMGGSGRKRKGRFQLPF